MLGTYLGGGKKAQEGRALRGGLHGRTSLGLFALHNADNCGHGHPGLLCGMDGADGGGACGADIVNDDYAGTLSTEAFDSPAGAVGLLRLADKKAMKQRSAGGGDGAPGRGCRHIRDDWIRAHGKAAYGFSIDVMLFEQTENSLAGEAAALCMQGGRAAIDVVIAGGAGGERELAKTKADAGQQGEELFRTGWRGHQR